MKSFFRYSGFTVILIISLVYYSFAADTLTVVFQSDKDAYVCDCEPNAVNPGGGEVTKLYQGPSFTGGHTCFDRSLIHWNISSLPQNITIESATIALKCTNSYGTPTGQMAFYRIIQSWNASTVTHNTAPQYTTDSAVFRSWPSVGQSFSVDATEFVRFWYTQSDSNLGILGHSVNTGTGSGCIGYYSSRCSDVTQRPNLTIKYVSNSTGVEEDNDQLPKELTLYQNFPNPFNPSTVISYKLSVVSEVRLSIYDLLGREVAVLVNGKQNTGTYQAQWNAAHMPSGTYFYKLQAGKYTEVKKLVLLK